MTDSEIETLRLAARAAGHTFGAIHGVPRILCDAGWTPWNPLTDDGDAFRLAVKLQLRVIPPEEGEFGLDRASVRVPGMRNLVDAFNKDPYAATRLAIVRAAAAMAQGEKV